MGKSVNENVTVAKQKEYAMRHNEWKQMGLTQVSYVNPSYVGKGTVSMIAGMSLGGLWM